MKSLRVRESVSAYNNVIQEINLCPNVKRTLGIYRDVLESKVPIYELNVPETNRHLIRIFYNGKIEGIELPKDKLVTGCNRVAMVIRDLISSAMIPHLPKHDQPNPGSASDKDEQNILTKKSEQDRD